MQSEVKLGDRSEIQFAFDEAAFLLIFLMLVIIEIFLISLVVILIKKFKLIKKSDAKKYYLFVLFYIGVKFGLCGYLQIIILEGVFNGQTLDSTKIQYAFDNSIVLSDCAIIELFLISFEQYIVLSFSVFANKIVQNFIKVLMQCAQFGAFIILFVLLIIFDIHRISYYTLNIFTMSLNSLSVVVFIITFFFMNFKMTGIMMQDTCSKTIKRVYKLLLGLLVSRVIASTVQVIILIQVGDQKFQTFIQNLYGEDQFVILGVCFILYLIFMILTQCLPLILSIRDGTISAMVNAQNMLKPPPSIYTQQLSLSVSSEKLHEPLISNTENISDEISSIDNRSRNNSDPNYGLNKIQNPDQLIPQNKYENSNQHYNVYKAKWKGNNRFYFVREFNKITNYICQQLHGEIQKYNLTHCKVINHFKILEKSNKKTIFIIQRFLPVNLQNKMDYMAKNDTNLKEKVSLALKITKAIRQFHDTFKTGHGVLHPTNILFDITENVYLTGFGMEGLKKYLALTNQYSNISMYTAVQLLGSARQKTISKPQKSADIYSFGFILFEIISLNFNYRQLSISQIRDKFQKQNTRPKIEQIINENIKNIIRKCWTNNPQKRPQIVQIITNLQILLSNIQ